VDPALKHKRKETPQEYAARKEKVAAQGHAPETSEQYAMRKAAAKNTKSHKPKWAPKQKQKA
jgi:hypothetical protein